MDSNGVVRAYCNDIGYAMQRLLDQTQHRNFVGWKQTPLFSQMQNVAKANVCLRTIFETVGSKHD